MFANFDWMNAMTSSPIFLVSEHVMGIKPGEPGWESIDFSPRPPELLEHAELTIPLPRGEAVVQYERSKGYTVTVPPGATSVGDNVTVLRCAGKAMRIVGSPSRVYMCRWLRFMAAYSEGVINHSVIESICSRMASWFVMSRPFAVTKASPTVVVGSRVTV